MKTGDYVLYNNKNWLRICKVTAKAIFLEAGSYWRRVDRATEMYMIREIDNISEFVLNHHEEIYNKYGKRLGPWCYSGYNHPKMKRKGPLYGRNY